MRWEMSKILWAVVLLASFCGSAAGQDLTDPGADPESQHAYVRVSTNMTDALLFADTVLIGHLDEGIQQIPVEVKRLRLVARDANTWSIPPVEAQVDAAEGDTINVDLHFPHQYRIESLPFGAKVYIERGDSREPIGTTPLLYTSEKPLESRIAVERPGYAIERINPGREIWNRHVVMLKPSDDLDPTAAKVSWKPPKKHRAWIDFAALGTAAAAGVVAVHYKFKADDLYSQYEQTADASLRDEIHAHDVRSGVALGVMQAGIGLFAIRLVLR